MSLKYKLGDVVVLGENVDAYKSFTPGALVRIGQLCRVGSNDQHYSIYPMGSRDSQWWVQDSEINHEATEALQKSNETGYIVGKIEAVSDDNAWFERGELPPIGSICEHEPSGFSNEWFSVEVLAHKEFKGHDTGLLVVFATEDDVSFSSGECFRPIKSPERTAAEERAAYCDRIYGVLSQAERKDKRSDMAEALYDAGLRFVGEDK